jgi:hypothetical protein
MAAPTTNAPNDRVNVAVIGVGMGCVDLAGILSNEWVHCLGMCDILAHMANISYRTGTLVVYDPNTRKFVNNSAADAFIKPAYRAPWKFPAL